MDLIEDHLTIEVLCEAIVDRYHASLQQLIDRVRDDLATLASTRPNPRIAILRDDFIVLADQIEIHLAKEENLLFPAFEALAKAARSGAGRPPLPFVTVVHPIRAMEAEHVRIEAALDQLRLVARQAAEPEILSACFLRCLSALSTLDDNLRVNHRMENEVLFPKALELERRFF